MELHIFDSCFECQESDSIEYIFLECTSSLLKLYDEILKCFNMEHNTNINPTLEQITEKFLFFYST